MKRFDFKEMMQLQKKFSDLFFDNSNLTQREKIELTKTFCLSMHSEAAQLVTAIDYKQHTESNAAPNLDRILFESVDCIRYIFAVLNLWDITPDQVMSAFSSKDNFLHMRHALTETKRRPGQKVIVCDVDDVLAQFRVPYAEFVSKNFGVEIDPFSKEYYNIEPINSAGIDPDHVFNKFISDGMFSNLPPCPKMINFLHTLRDRGYWIQLLTARPGNDARSKYDTYDWLAKNEVPFDNVDFTPEKYVWLSDKDFYREGDLICAIDDSLKHALEYARHGVDVVVPKTSYNSEFSANVAKKIKRVDHDDVKMLSAIDNIILANKGEEYARK